MTRAATDALHQEWVQMDWNLTTANTAHSRADAVYGANGPGPPGTVTPLSVFHGKCCLYSIFALARRALDGPKRWFPDPGSDEPRR
jgi:hypothetical protein